ncbi:MAG: hypothetical protein ACTHMS_04115 [Jatrophihabitans sp.]|uniref:hypothetical protein n=1 Tax=Jatrophihabitans sp. TaxID=1932789 RepID=UPI003F81FE72
MLVVHAAPDPSVRRLAELVAERLSAPCVRPEQVAREVVDEADLVVLAGGGEQLLRWLDDPAVRPRRVAVIAVRRRGWPRRGGGRDVRRALRRKRVRPLVAPRSFRATALELAPGQEERAAAFADAVAKLVRTAP